LAASSPDTGLDAMSGSFSLLKAALTQSVMVEPSHQAIVAPVSDVLTTWSSSAGPDAGDVLMEFDVVGGEVVPGEVGFQAFPIGRSAA
jgi:hypothetical protein